jgi:protein-S-isoprenylcysteine O-methyltransferase Ste14
MSHPPIFALLILVTGFVVWLVPFVRAGWSQVVPVKSDSRAMWGLALEVAGYGLVCFSGWSTTRVVGWRAGVSVLFLECAAMLSWTSTRSLGRFLRLDAAVEPDHELIRSGPYRIVRHPIYASMLCLLLGIGSMVAPLAWFAVAVVVFLAGTEIRVRVEDRLLAERFGEEFHRYCQSTRAYLPFVR